MKISQCGSVMHEVRTSLLVISGLAIDALTEKLINDQIDRIAKAVSKRDKFKNDCGDCENRVEVKPQCRFIFVGKPTSGG